MTATVRIAAAQTANRTIPFRVGGPAEALARVEVSLTALTALADQAADAGCALVVFPEDALGTLEWESGHWDEVAALLRPAEASMLARFGEVARRRGLAIVVCNDLLGPPGEVATGDAVPAADGTPVYNTAILLGADGAEVGRYHKVHPTWAERYRAVGRAFPVYDVPGVGPVGMCICYDMVFPETTRALALNGADIVTHSTLGGASFGDGDASLAAFRTRAADNFVYLVVAHRGGGSMVIGPKGQVLAQATGSGDRLVVADVDAAGGRQAGDALGGTVSDYRARLFRERNPAAYAALVDPEPPALARLRHVDLPTARAASQRLAAGLTTGAEAFTAAEGLVQQGRTDEARRRFAALDAAFGTTWIGRAARERLAALGGT